MMRYFNKLLIILFILLMGINSSFAQLIITPESNAIALAQKLVGNGVVISNITLTGDARATGFFNNTGRSNLNIDSGIVLTNGRAKTQGFNWGVDGNGTMTASATLANLQQFPLSVYSGDNDLAKLISVDSADTHDACILEFDFVPLGDTVRFNYIFSSEEYTPPFVCTFNDAFAFFISGPGILGQKNIALIPGTSMPVSIFNVNDVPFGGCPNNTSYYVDNTANTYFTHDGHTTVFNAVSAVQPCQTYHLKLVIADVGDGSWDSGVFVEAKSLSSNAIQINNLTQTDNIGNSYLVEGCVSGSFQIKRPNLSPAPLVVNLSYGGTAQNGLDIQTLPSSVIIPGGDTVVTVNVIPIIDLLPEGIETLVVYALAGCSVGVPTDSAVIQVRDYDTLGISPADTSFICKNASVQLTASSGYSVYLWDTDPTLSSMVVSNPVAIPVTDTNVYYCTATEGTCNARDSVTLRWKKLFLTASTGVDCKDASNGEIRVSAGPGWVSPFLFSINNNPYQTDSTFLNLPAGMYSIKIKDATGCVDSMDIPVTQLFPDLLISDTATTAASCLGKADGSITIIASGGKNPYQYSIDGINFQSSNFFSITGGNHSITVKDSNNCSVSQNIFIPLNNTVTLSAGSDTTICEGKNIQLNSVSNGAGFIWSPAASLNNSLILNPVASPVTTTKYYITATTGICSKTDSVTVFVNPAPIPNAGADAVTCYKGNIQLNGSGGVNFTWSPSTYLNDAAIFNPVVTAPSTSITYSLAVTGANGCSSLKDDSIYITVTSPPQLYAGNDTAIAIRQPLALVANDVNSTGFISYLWSPAYGLNNPFIANPVTVLDKEITYYVSASTAIGCQGFDTIKIKVYQGPELYIPNSFTPNSDGLNDILKVISVGMKEFHFFRVYNRYGQLIFTTSDPYKGWDGTVNGKLQNTGAYIWMAEAIDYKGNLIQRNGTTIIIR